MQRQAVTRQYKDRLFRMAFREKHHLLALYNAINGSTYEDPEALEITTLEDVIYLGMKNDASFVLDAILNLWEHQSTLNPNMPVRALNYFAQLYQQYIKEHRLNVYGTKLQKLPFPQYVVFYNGKSSAPDCMELRLSDAFIRSPNIPADRQPCLEIRAMMLNINWGRNKELMDECQRLREYAQCIATIRSYEADAEDRETAIAEAVNQCIAQGFLADILSKNKSEVIALFLTEYDEQAQRELDREEARAEGQTEGLHISLIRLIQKKLRKNLSAEDIAELVEEPLELVRQICRAIMEHPDWTAEELYDQEKERLFQL